MPKIDINTGLKICSLCREKKTEDFFPRHRGKPDGLSYQCKKCISKSQKSHKALWRKNNRELIKQQSKIYWKKKKTDAEYIAKKRLAFKNYYYKNKEKLNKARAIYAKETPIGRAINLRHQKKRNGVILQYPKLSTKELADLYFKSDDRCFYCYNKLHGKYEFDHYIPISKNGEHTIKNLRISCKRCNRSKKDKMPDIFFNDVFPRITMEVYHRLA